IDAEAVTAKERMKIRGNLPKTKKDGDVLITKINLALPQTLTDCGKREKNNERKEGGDEIKKWGLVTQQDFDSGMIKDDFELIDVWMLWQCYEEEIPETEKEMHQYIDGRQDQPSNAALRDAADEAENPLNRPKTRPEKKILKGLPRAVARTKCVRVLNRVDN
ncbi:hypothetical protein OUZ56_010937, partial [Daphnia magna]